MQEYPVITTRATATSSATATTTSSATATSATATSTTSATATSTASATTTATTTATTATTTTATTTKDVPSSILHYIGSYNIKTRAVVQQKVIEVCGVKLENSTTTPELTLAWRKAKLLVYQSNVVKL